MRFTFGRLEEPKDPIMCTTETEEKSVRLDLFSNREFDRGASLFVEGLWTVVSGLLVGSWLPGSSWRCYLLRLFGAKIGRGVVIKPHVSVKFPWRLSISDHVWIGEHVWIDNLDNVSIGAHTCISQGAFLCTGSHDWRDPKFKLVTRPIYVGKNCWVCAKANIAPGAKMEDGSVVAFGGCLSSVLPSDTIQFVDGTRKSR